MLVTLGVLGAGYLAVCALVASQQRHLVFPAPRVRAELLGASRFVDVPQGTFLLWRDAGPRSPVVVHFHGNGEQAASRADLAELLAAQGVSFAAVEYPGYAGAPGAPSEATLVEAAERALEHLTNGLGVERSRLILSGQSIGTGVAVAMAARGWGTKLLLLSPYTSLPDVGASAFPWLPVRLLMRDRFESAVAAPGIALPVLIVHGTEDTVIPVSLGRSLAARFPQATFTAVAGAGHNDLWTRAEVIDAVLRFTR